MGHFSVVQMEESANLSHHIQGIALDLHSSQHHHVPRNAQRFLLGYLGRGGEGVALYTMIESPCLYDVF